MQYVCDLGAGQQLTLQNEGALAYIGFHSAGPGQQQSQRVSNDTGSWTGKPTVLRQEDKLVLQIDSSNGTSFFSVHGNRITPLPSQPHLENAKELPLRKADEAAEFKPLEPMQPMRPMKPMDPLRPMEMRMGNMSMKMVEESGSGATPAKKFCTQCGNALDPEDRFCGKCGHKV